MTDKIPEGFHTITPSLVLEEAGDALALYSKAFGAKMDYRMEMPDSKKVMHACMTIGSSKLFLSDTTPEMCATPTSARFYLYFDDVDAAFAQAIEAGLDCMMEPEDMFWGDRIATVKDKFGIIWTLATHVRDVTEKEMIEGQASWSKKVA